MLECASVSGIVCVIREEKGHCGGGEGVVGRFVCQRPRPKVYRCVSACGHDFALELLVFRSRTVSLM